MTLQECVLSGRQYPSRLQLTKHCTAWRAPVSSLIARLLISLLSSHSLLVGYVLGSRLSRPQQSGVYAASLQALSRRGLAWNKGFAFMLHPPIIRWNVWPRLCVICG